MDYKDLIIKYLTNGLTEEERIELINWMVSDRQNEKVFKDLSEAWIVSGAARGSSGFDSNTGWDNLYRKLHGDIGKKHAFVPTNRKIRILKAAATWLVFFGLGLLSMYIMSNRTIDISPVEGNVAVNVPIGSRSSITLPDGSQVWINAGSKLTYSNNYGVDSRELELTGEAFFDVAKDKKKPFIVNVDGMKIRALGTRFNVKAYPDEDKITATLEEGKMDAQIEKPDGDVEHIILLPKQNIIYQKNESSVIDYVNDEPVRYYGDEEGKDTVSVDLSDITVIKNVNTVLYTSWKDDKWIIERQPLDDLAVILERRFGVKIFFKDDMLQQYNFTGTIQNETIEQILNALTLTAPVKFEITRDSITLSSDSVMKEKFKQITKPQM